MTKCISIISLLFLPFSFNAQVGIGTTTPDASSILHLESTSQGFILTRVGLTSTTDVTTVATPVKGLIVYNTGLNGLTPEGIYQWKGSNWALILDSATSLSGDVTGTIGANTVTKLQGIPVVNTPPNNNQVLRYDGSQWQPSDDSVQSWFLAGNNTTSSGDFLGTLDDVKVQFRSNNSNFLEIGNRNTLGLVEATTDYTNPTQKVTYMRSALQFDAPGTSFKPIFFVDTDGNFEIKASAATTDFFSIGSTGSSDAGALEFQIGNDGNEPIIFRRNHDVFGSKEMMRMQGVTSSSSVRVGIGLVGEVSANSTFQVVGSQSNSINTFTSSSVTLNDTHYTVVLNSGVVNLGLPTAVPITGRIYCIRNSSGGTINISTYRNLSNATVTTIAPATVIYIQSDGANWLQIR